MLPFGPHSCRRTIEPKPPLHRVPWLLDWGDAHATEDIPPGVPPVSFLPSNMTQMLSLAPRQMDIAPIQPSMDLNELSRRGHSEAAFGGLHDSSSPIAEAMMRRPPVSVGTPNTHQDLRDHHLRLSTATAPHPDAGQDTMCLCTPTPKIPRPRNGAFLFFLCFLGSMTYLCRSGLRRGRKERGSSSWPEYK